MEKPARYKAKNKKPAAKPKTAKKRKNCDGPSCSMFLADLTRRLASRRKITDEEPRNIIQTIIDSITNALPIKISKKNSPVKHPSPIKIETLQSFAPELQPNDTLNFLPPVTIKSVEDESKVEEEIASERLGAFKMPKMPIINSEALKLAVAKQKAVMQDQGVNTGTELDVAAEISRHVSTLKRISLIAEEFNQKTAKNLKEIVDSVQEDLMKKLTEIQQKQSSKAFHAPEDSVGSDDLDFD